jgi:hypothetical protein
MSGSFRLRVIAGATHSFLSCNTLVPPVAAGTAPYAARRPVPTLEPQSTPPRPIARPHPPAHSPPPAPPEPQIIPPTPTRPSERHPRPPHLRPPAQFSLLRRRWWPTAAIRILFSLCRSTACPPQWRRPRARAKQDGARRRGGRRRCEVRRWRGRYSCRRYLWQSDAGRRDRIRWIQGCCLGAAGGGGYATARGGVSARGEAT